MPIHSPAAITGCPIRRQEPSDDLGQPAPWICVSVRGGTVIYSWMPLPELSIRSRSWQAIVVEGTNRKKAR